MYLQSVYVHRICECKKFSMYVMQCVLCTVRVHREESGMFVQKPKYKSSLRKISSIQSKIEGWEVSLTNS